MKVSVIPVVCGPGETLQNGVCVPALAPPPGQQCPEGQVLVNGVCVDRIVTVPIPTAQEFVNQAQDKYLPAGYTMPTGVYDHGALWVSDDCRAWVMGRDWDMTNAGYDAGQFWFENDIEWIPMYPRGQVDFPEQATANYYGREIMFGIKEDCYPLIPDPENFADFSSYKAMRESLAVDDPGVYKLWRALSDIASSNMYQRLLQEKNGGNAPDQLLNRWGAQRVVMRWINGQYPNATLDDLANEAYWWAYPDCPQTLPSPAQARPGLERDCIERWNAILRIVNDLVNAWNLQSY
jgi:hypothetical protein